jgi:hypothetical protein
MPSTYNSAARQVERTVLFNTLIALSWSSYYAMAVIELGQAVAREMKNRP